MTFHARTSTPLGEVLLCTDGASLSGLYFTGQKDCPVLEGLPGVKADGSDPTSGLMAGVPIKTFKAYKRAADSIAKSPRSAARAVGGLHLMQDATPPQAIAVLEQTETELREYFEGRRTVFNVPLSPDGTLFQKQVWSALLQISYGAIMSYGDVARAAGLTARHGRPVGTAVGRNPITIIIPCHRVLSGAGLLTGYTGGLQRKFALLELEGYALR